jgi:putative spermidine/putrescine transport system substrate-binding protein
MASITKITLALLCAASVQAFATASFADPVLPQAVRDKVNGELVLHDVSGGALSRARDETTNKDFTAETDVTVVQDFNADMTKFFAAMESGAEVPWSVIEFPTQGDFMRARDSGYLEKLDPAIVDAAKLEPGAFEETGVHIMRYGIVMTYNTDVFKGDQVPTSLKDLYNLEKFPGKRCMFKYPQFSAVLESALLADGVSRDQLYPLDLDRAFKKLDTIKSDIIWYGNGDEAVRLIASGDCSMGVTWSGRSYSFVKNDKAPIAIVWQDSLYAQSVYAVPKGAPNAVAGQAFIAHFISDIPGQIELVRQITYTTPLAGVPLSAYGEDMTPWIVAGDNAEKAIPENAEYYSTHINEAVDRFNRWLALN